MKRSIVILVCLLLIFQISSLSADVLDPDLVLYFDFEEFKGGSVIEKSGRGYDGKINGKSDTVKRWQVRQSGTFFSRQFS